ncbi:MAG: hypothetical protein HYR96_09555 [Deltaproteobacteria bacterium]|nr:hypothetical protein [Deltaproteobacteria bacterium]
MSAKPQNRHVKVVSPQDLVVEKTERNIISDRSTIRPSDRDQQTDLVRTPKPCDSTLNDKAGRAVDKNEELPFTD